MVAPGDYEKIMNVEKKEVAKEKKEGKNLLVNFYVSYGLNIYHQQNQSLP